jgi:hypothetical protein
MMMIRLPNFATKELFLIYLLQHSISLLFFFAVFSLVGVSEAEVVAQKKKTPIAKSTPTSLPTTKVKLFSPVFFEETCRYLVRDGWGEYTMSILLGIAGGGTSPSSSRAPEKCSECRSLIKRFSRGCQRVATPSEVPITQALEPAPAFISYLTGVVHNSAVLPTAEEIKTFLSVLALAHQKGTSKAKEYFSIIDLFLGPPLLNMLSQRTIKEPKAVDKKLVIG